MKTSRLSFLLALLALPLSLHAATAAANVGQTVTIGVTVAAGTSPFSYQWQKNGQPIAGATAAMLVLPSVQPSDSANYFVVVTNSVGSTISDAAQVTVTAIPPSGATLNISVK